MELRKSHLRYLLVIYELGRIKPDTGIADIAKALDCSKASVTNMMSNLMEMGLLVRERYGKVYLTDTGFLLAKGLFRCVTELQERLPALGLDLAPEDAGRLAHTIVLDLPESCRDRLVGEQNA
ncbi:metal-dependent transcriptional regulator [Oscillibacter sp.]|uniref:metal-dependent transcriptional regulator n=1 Tax=Oscillibacter sp. TaxID=1945593 RepID=UPI001B783CF2|nr:MarR family transcriptional regulator [Oscillibacter sp.]MBP3508394.1 MarR family transcriptional regulator [Oscillibacter sp.]